ncbi:MAG: hypothetical protein SGJ27_01535 [Candidatus Melainabacteria bacterium]|nr:hypothetical protein [Candidatus Melainabacteria bacterium]
MRALTAIAMTVSLCLVSGLCTIAQAADTKGGASSESAKSALPYQRLDFQVKANCVTCLRKVAKALKASRGVLSADVSIYYPHWAVVIIDTSLTDDKKIVERIAKEKANIDKMYKQDLKEKPLIVVPRSDTPARL